MAVDAVVSHLKTMSRNVTTPEEIAQVLVLSNMDSVILVNLSVFLIKSALIAYDISAKT